MSSSTLLAELVRENLAVNMHQNNVGHARCTCDDCVADLAKELPLAMSGYEDAAHRTISDECRNDIDKALLNAAMGLGGEGGEVLDHLKKHLFHGHPLDLSHIAKELGDILWYVAEACYAIGIPMSEVAELNVDKLKKRYPDGFSSERSLSRLDMVEVDMDTAALAPDFVSCGAEINLAMRNHVCGLADGHAGDHQCAGAAACETSWSNDAQVLNQPGYTAVIVGHVTGRIPDLALEPRKFSSRAEQRRYEQQTARCVACGTMYARHQTSDHEFVYPDPQLEFAASKSGLEPVCVCNAEGKCQFHTFMGGDPMKSQFEPIAYRGIHNRTDNQLKLGSKGVFDGDKTVKSMEEVIDHLQADLLRDLPRCKNCGHPLDQHDHANGYCFHGGINEDATTYEPMDEATQQRLNLEQERNEDVNLLGLEP